MVTPDKDFAQLVAEKTFISKPGRAGDGAEILRVPEILKQWEIERVDQVIDMLGLMGDASDNVPGIGPKTAQKLIAQYGSVEGDETGLPFLRPRSSDTASFAQDSCP
jgi:DNA polymerase-1